MLDKHCYSKYACRVCIPANNRRRAWLVGVLLVCVNLTGCGGDASGSVAVRVGTNSITSASVGHWMSVIAAGASTTPGQPTPKPPDPPGYAKCIAYLRAYAPWAESVKGRPRVTTKRLKAQCEYEYQKLKLKALYAVIPYAWITGEAAELKVTVTSAELQRRLALLKSQFPNEAAFKQYVTNRGATIGDLLVDMRQSALAETIKHKLESESTTRSLTSAQRQERLNKFSSEYVAKWTARTDCQPGYIVPLCKQYDLPKMPLGLKPPTIPLTEMSAE